MRNLAPRGSFAPFAAIAVAATAAALGCSVSSTPTPNALLIGTWSSPAASLTGGIGGAGLVLPCLSAHLPPLRLDDSLRFDAMGVVTSASSLAARHRGDPFPLTGEVVGRRVVIQYPSFLRGTPTDTLTPGHRDVSRCPA